MAILKTDRVDIFVDWDDGMKEDQAVRKRRKLFWQL